MKIKLGKSGKVLEQFQVDSICSINKSFLSHVANDVITNLRHTENMLQDLSGQLIPKRYECFIVKLKVIKQTPTLVIHSTGMENL